MTECVPTSPSIGVCVRFGARLPRAPKDLRRHEAEFERRLAFAYTVCDAAAPERIVGCCYINPAARTTRAPPPPPPPPSAADGGARSPPPASVAPAAAADGGGGRAAAFDAEVYLWLRPSLERAASGSGAPSFDAELEAALRAWLAPRAAGGAWPFGPGRVVFPGRDRRAVFSGAGDAGDDDADAGAEDVAARWSAWEALPWRGVRVPRITSDGRTVVMHDMRGSGLIP